MAKKNAETKQEEIKVDTEAVEVKEVSEKTETEKIVEASKVAQEAAEVKEIFWGFQSIQNGSPFQMNMQMKRIWDALCDLNDRVKKLEK